MSRLREVIKEWEQSPPYEGIRIATPQDVDRLTDREVQEIEFILDCMERSETIVFKYENEERVAIPFVVGISSEGNPLMRGWQAEGKSKSGKGAGWRVYQINKMETTGNYFEYFDFEGVGFSRDYPWIYKVVNML